MTLNLIGIGLGDEKDITLKGLELVKKSDFVYLESYTSKLNTDIKKLEKLYGKKIIMANRDIVEKQAETTILKNAKDKEVSFLVIGDVFGATTHIDLVMRAEQKGIKVNVIHNASIINVIGVTGLELYKFGKTTSIPFENKNVKSPVDIFRMNYDKGMHTLFLLDLRPDEDRYMTIAEASEYLIKSGIDDDLIAVACGGLGSEEAVINTAKLEDLK
jgi:diphthine synthase